MIKLVMIIAFLLLHLNFITAQQYLFNAQNLTTEDGLANLLTTAIFQDSKGLIWIGTQYGLNRYDGYTFQLFTKENHGLRNNNSIQSIMEDESGKLWLFYTKYTGDEIEKKWSSSIDIFNPKTQKAIPFDEYFKDASPFKGDQWQISTIKDPKNRLWISTNKGQLYLYHQGIFEKIFDREGFLFSYLTIDHKDNIWLNNENQLLYIDNKGKVLEKFQLPDPIKGLWTTKNDKLWLTTVSGGGKMKKVRIWLKNKEDKELTTLQLRRNGISETAIANAYRSQEGFWYTEINQQLSVFAPNGDWIVNFQEQVKNGPTSFLNALETVQHIWLTSSDGILKASIKNNPFHLIHSRNRLSDCRNITEDEHGNVYFLNTFPYQWNPKSRQLKKLSNSIGNIGLIYTDSLLWMGYYGNENLGHQLNLRNGEEEMISNKADNTGARTTIKTSQDDIWLIGMQKGLSYLDLKKKKHLPFNKYNDFEELKTKSVNHFHKNETGIWIATELGIYLMKEKQGIVKHYSKAAGDLPFDNIHHIFEDEEGLFWLASKGGGLIRWTLNGERSPTYRQFTTADGLSHNYLYAVYRDDYGKLWISSDKGLMCMDKKTFNIKTFLIRDGLKHNEFNFTAHHQAKDGTIYFGGLGGLITFHPKSFAHESSTFYPLKFIDCHMLEEGEDKMTDKTQILHSTKEIIFRPEDKLLELQVTLLDYDEPEQHHYAYKIEGFSDYWNNIDENLIRITHLPYGHYTLKVKGQNKRTDWSINELSLDIHVVKPFYWRWWFLTVLGLLLAGIITGVWKWRNKELQKRQERLENEVRKRTHTISKQAEALKELDVAKTQFFSNITHEFRTPLTLIIGPLEQIINEQVPSGIFKRRLHGVLKNARQLLGLINQMLDLSKIESGGMSVALTRGDLIAYTKELTKRFQPLAQKKEQRLVFIACQDHWETHFDKSKWDKIVYNLLSNAIKFTPIGEAIQISLKSIRKENKEFIRLDVKDTGNGIEKDHLQQVFNRFYQADSSSTRMQEGTGIGLALVKELVELQEGEIKAASCVDKGTTFEVHLPIPSADKVKSLIDKMMTTPAVPIAIPLKEKPLNIQQIPATNKGEKLELLIIEDNEEMREYIQYCIDLSRYNITEAEDGEAGILKAQNLIPDLIISDIMMPKKDGFEVTQAIRNNLITSHIPLILLTAKASLESRLKGLQRGADVYLTKPFSPQELALRIQKLIEIRQLLQQRYNNNKTAAKNGTFKHEQFKKEDEYIIQLREYILQNIDESKLNGESIGKHFGISRVHLYRKLKALTDLSISEFVRNIRLQKAMELIREGKFNISEIGYQVGFSSTSHFSRTFKKCYGKTPSEVYNTRSNKCNER